MLLTELLGLPVRDAGGVSLGTVADVRFVLDGPPSGNGAGALAEARLHGLIVSPHGGESFLGYERSRVDRPWLIAHVLAARQRHAVLVLWDDIAEVGEELRLRPGAIRYSPALPGSR
ncbi:PRC-barrel domain-containing protein [Gryllotalpicola protaetiae]|uniref:PRC-barrel domain containing protein n=1 Tax=Gryllotalpicola protaetiae TaxID=2419771 RepID=A0A387BTL3_9MICO|nr:PRC-barrel domain containing protein [Gryllotalpicola protaetiae]AYG04379.1 PRC-barrel domain containing protein [Gryllotalpicola protaetiae]